MLAYRGIHYVEPDVGDEDDSGSDERPDPRYVWRDAVVKKIREDQVWEDLNQEPPTAKFDPLEVLRQEREERLPSLHDLIGYVNLLKERANPKPIDSFSITILEGGFGSTRRSEKAIIWPAAGDMDAMLDLVDSFDAVVANSKETAPCFVPAIFKVGSKTRTLRDADVGTALVFDIDRGNVSSFDLQKGLERLGIACLFWPTWQAGGAQGLRWRVLVPLASPVAVRGAYGTLWKRIGNHLVNAVAAEAGIADPWGLVGANAGRGLIDWDPSPVRASILPCYPEEGTGSERYPWGGIKPAVEVVEGDLLDPGADAQPRTAPAPKVAKPLRTTDENGKPLVQAFKAIVPPYVPNPDAAHVSKTLKQLPAFAEGGTPMPLLALDAVARLRRDGVRVPKGTRHDTLSGAAWTLLRCGMTKADIATAIGDIVQATPKVCGQDYLIGEALRLIPRFERKCDDSQVLEDLIVATCRTRVPPDHRNALRHYARILSRAEHLRNPKGGALCHESIGKMVGVDIKVITGMRGKIREAGFISETGDGKARRYRLIAST